MGITEWPCGIDLGLANRSRLSYTPIVGAIEGEAHIEGRQVAVPKCSGSFRTKADGIQARCPPESRRSTCADDRGRARCPSRQDHRMKRRDFLLLAASTVLVSKAALATEIPHIGVIGPGSRQANQTLMDVFRDDLHSFGWSDGNNLKILDRWAEERTDQLPGIAKELVGSGVDILVTVGTPATLAARSATVRIPVILVGVGDPVSLGVVSSLARPGGYITGISLSCSELIEKRLRLLQELVPGLRRVAVIARDDPGLERMLLDLRNNADRMDLKLVEFVATTGKALELVFRWLHSDPCEGLYLASGPLGPAKRAEIIALAAESRIPAIYPFREFAVAGGLMSFAADHNDLFRRAAIFVDDILKGAKPADLPVEQPTKFELTVNLKTAKALGLTVPHNILDNANEVIQ